jgi:hypothetical protein
VRSRTAGVMTLMRNGRDRRLGKPVTCHARKERVFLVGTRSADHIRASGHSGCIQRPDTWLHPNASLKRQIPLASRAPSLHGTFETCRPALTGERSAAVTWPAEPTAVRAASATSAVPVAMSRTCACRCGRSKRTPRGRTSGRRHHWSIRWTGRGRTSQLP